MEMDRYNKVFMDVFDLKSAEELSTLEYHKSEKWDSIGHMMLCAAMEDEFNVHFEGEDILDFQSYEEGISILKKYGVAI